MLEPPDVPLEKISTCLLANYGLQVVQLAFLPLGADMYSAAYRAVTADGTLYFVKLRTGVFDETSVALPKFLNQQGIPQVLAPLPTQTGLLRAELDTSKIIVYPFIDGHNGFEMDLTDRQWREFGTALKRIHTTVIPPAITNHLQREAYSPQWRETVKQFLTQAQTEVFVEPVAAKLAAFLNDQCTQILDLISRAERLASVVQSQPLEYIVCHSDIHVGNIILANDGALYIVDWDAPILAPKERDLMFIGGGVGGLADKAREEALFYQGYGPTEINPTALAYYRYERLVQDISAFCEQLFYSPEGGEDREQSFQYLASNFLPGGVLEIAYKSDKTQGER
jgi:spectinomycin phosphotransferase